MRVILVAICIIISIIVGISFMGNNYRMSYLRIDGVSLGSTREEVIRKLGEPINTTVSDCGRFSSFHYDGIKFSIASTVIGIVITNPDIRFGRSNIGVGSTRYEIEQVKWSSWPLNLFANHLDNVILVTYGHDSESIRYSFDENNILYQIVIGFSSS